MRQTLPGSPRRSGDSPLKIALILGGILAALLAGLWLIFKAISFLLVALLPTSWEAAIGEAFAVHYLEESGGQCPMRAAEAAALKRLTAPLMTAAELQDVRFYIADNAAVNALAFPGGHVVILRGLLDTATSPDMVAGVVAHELGHVYHRHSAEGVSDQIALWAIIETLTGGSGLSWWVLDLAGLAGSRAAEREADAFAVEVMHTSGLDPRALADFLRLIDPEGASGASGGDELINLLSTHPLSNERIEAVEAAARKAERAALGARDWTTLKDVCD